MGDFTKGIKTRTNIIREVNRLFNEREKLLTLDEIAHELGLTKSRITNHFPKKELLMLGIYQEYEKQLEKLLRSSDKSEGRVDFLNLLRLYSDFMDLLYKYRFAISFLYINPMKEEVLTRHVTDTFIRNKERIYQRMESMVQSGLLDARILNSEDFGIFLFKHTTLMTTWIISHRIYDNDKKYEQIKPVYIEGILSCMEVYLTVRGKEEYEKTMERTRSIPPG